MAYQNLGSSRARREIPEEDKKDLLKNMGFDAGAYIGHGSFGTVFNGICNASAKKLVAVGSNEKQTWPPAFFDPISRSYVREISLNGKPCAIKMFHDRTQWTDKIYNEVKTLVDLAHPNIVEIYSVCKSNNNIYIIMELVNGGSLKNFLNSLPLEKKLDEFIVIRIIRDLAAGLQYLHNQNIVHGDLHNENIVISVENNDVFCKFVDFGNSKALNREEKNQIKDITDLAYHFNIILDKSTFVRTHIKGNIKAIVNMMSNGVFTDMNQVVSHLSKYLPSSDAPPNSMLKQFAKFFSK